MKVLVLNCGSSSVKFQLVETDEALATTGRDRALAKGLIENIGSTALLRYQALGGPALRESAEMLEHKVAIERVLGLLERPHVCVVKQRREIEAVGHRVVHGGERFKASVRLDDRVLAAIEECFELAPLHNPPNVNAPAVRARALIGLGSMGLRLDPARNDGAVGTEAEISPQGATPKLFVIPTNEELLIARDTYRIVTGLPTA